MRCPWATTVGGKTLGGETNSFRGRGICPVDILSAVSAQTSRSRHIYGVFVERIGRYRLDNGDYSALLTWT